MTPVEWDVDPVDPQWTERGLRRYVRSVAAELRLGPEGAWCEMAEEASAYLALDARSPRHPGRDVALVWGERHGWAMGVETGSGEDVLIVAWYGPELLPAPVEVARFVRAVLAGQVDRPEPPMIPADQRNRLCARLGTRSSGAGARSGTGCGLGG